MVKNPTQRVVENFLRQGYTMNIISDDEIEFIPPPTEYRGWKLTCDPNRPATRYWEAERNGVVLCASYESAIKRVVSERIKQYPPDGD